MKLFLPTKAFWLASLIVFAALFLPEQTKAQYVTIPDPNFVSWLQGSEFAGCMNGNQLDTTCNTVVAALSIDCGLANISNLDGVQYFDNLEQLSCDVNFLTNLPPLPSSLLVLSISNNQFTSLPQMPVGLTHLSCNNNQLAELSGLPSSLEFLNCNNNLLTQLPALPSGLTTLHCRFNALTSLPTLPPSLQYLNCSYNPNLSCLPPLENVTELHFTGTAIACIPSPNNVTASGPWISNYPSCGTLTVSSVPVMTGDSLYTNYLTPGHFSGYTIPLFNWNTGATTSEIIVNDAGTYNVTVNAVSGCEEAASLTVSGVPCDENQNINVGITHLYTGTDTCSLLPALLDAGSDYQSYLWDNGQTTQSIVVDEIGYYNVTVTDNNGCTATGYISTGYFIPVWIESDAFGDPGCVGSPVTLVARSYLPLESYDWYHQPDPVNNPGWYYQYYGLDSVFTTDSGGYFVVNVTDPNTGCPYGADAYIESAVSPVVTITAEPEDCSLNVVNLTTDVIGSAPFTYLWNNGETTQSTVSSGNGPFDVTVTDAYGCSTSASATTQSSDINLNSTSVHDACNMGQGSITVHASGGVQPYTYQWYLFSDLLTDTDSVIEGLFPGDYHVFVTDANGCTSDQLIVIVGFYDPLVVTFDDAYVPWCQWGIELSPIVEGTPPYQYAWNNGETTSSIVFNGPSATFGVTVTDANGCTASDDAFFTTPDSALYPGPFGYTFDGNCNDGIQVGIDFVTAGEPPYSFLWSTGETTQYINALPGVEYGLTIYDASGCFMTNDGNTFGSAIGDAVVTNASCGSENGAIDITVNGNMPDAIQWSNGATTEDLTNLSAGIYHVTVIYESGICSLVDSFEVSGNETLAPTITMTSTGACSEFPFTLDAGPGYDSYAWSNGEITQTITLIDNGLYSVTVTNANDCTGTDSIYLYAPPPPEPIIVVPSSNLCAGSSIVLDATNPFGTQYLWGNGETSSSIVVDQPGYYDVLVITPDGCIHMGGIAVVEFPAPTVTIAATGTNPCVPTVSTLSADVNGGTAPYSFLWSTGFTASSIEGFIGTYSVTAMDANGCNAADEITLDAPEPIEPEIYVTYSPTCSALPATLTANAGYNSYLWSNGETTSTIVINAPGLYELTVSNSSGCTGSTFADVAVPLPPLPVVVISESFCGSTLLSTADPYFSYLWSTGETTETIVVTQSGVYSVTTLESEQGCAPEGEIVVNVTPTVNGAVSITNDFCGLGNGSASVVAVGTPPFFYTWDNGATTESIENLSAGFYEVTVVDANGCSAVPNGTVLQGISPLPQIVATYTNPCVGEALLDAGAGFIFYVWSTGDSLQTISVTGFGWYYVTVTDVNGCTGVDSTLLTGPPPFELAIGGDTALCAGATSELSVVNMPSDLPREWSTGETTSTIIVSSAGEYSVTVFDPGGCFFFGEAVVTESPALSVVIVTGDVSCDLSIVELFANPSGGAMPFDFLWNNGSTASFTVQSGGGPFVVTATDANGCTAVDSAFVLPTPPTLVTFTGDTAFCNGEFTTIGLVDNYVSYLWSNGATTPSIEVSNAGLYAVTVYVEGGCEAGSGSVTVTQHSIPTLLVTPSNVVNGNDGAANLETFGGGAPYSYVWSNGATTQNIEGLAPGLYTVTVTTAAGCTVAANALVGDPTGCNLAVTVIGINVKCYKAKNGSASPQITGGAGPFTYQWSNGKHTKSIFNIGVGTYSVTVTDVNGCTATAVVTITQPPPLVVYTNASHTCPGECTATASVVVVSGGTQPYTYQWEGGETTTSVSGLCIGIYWVTVFDANGCKKIVGASITPGNPQDCNFGNIQRDDSEDGSANALQLYPNPTGNHTTVLLPPFTGEASLRVTNALGQVLFAQRLDDNVERTQINLRGLPAGVYTVTFENWQRRESAMLIKQ